MARMLSYFILLGFYSAWATQDINLAQLEFISNHLSQTDCRQLVASLTSAHYELDPRYVREGFNLPETAACIQLLAEWAAEQDRDLMLNQLVRRLRQLHHVRLSEWLSKTSFENSELELRKSFSTAKQRRCQQKNITESTPLIVKKEKMEKKILEEEKNDKEQVVEKKQVVEKEQVVEKKQVVEKEPVVEKEKVVEKEQVVENVDSEFVLNEAILDRLKKFVPDKKVWLEILLGVGVLTATILLLLSIRLLVKWCLKCRHRRKGYRNVEYDFVAKNSEELDVEEEMRKYCKC